MILCKILSIIQLRNVVHSTPYPKKKVGSVNFKRRLRRLEKIPIKPLRNQRLEIHTAGETRVEPRWSSVYHHIG